MKTPDFFKVFYVGELYKEVAPTPPEPPKRPEFVPPPKLGEGGSGFGESPASKAGKAPPPFDAPPGMASGTLIRHTPPERYAPTPTSIKPEHAQKGTMAGLATLHDELKPPEREGEKGGFLHQTIQHHNFEPTGSERDHFRHLASAASATERINAISQHHKADRDALFDAYKERFVNGHSGGEEQAQKIWDTHYEKSKAMPYGGEQVSHLFKKSLDMLKALDANVLVWNAMKNMQKAVSVMPKDFMKDFYSEDPTHPMSVLNKALPPGPKKGQTIEEHAEKTGVENAKKTPPKEYREGGATGKRDYADPKNYKYPIDTDEHVRAAISYFSKPKNYGMYEPAERKAMWSRIRKAAKKFGISVGDKDAPGTGEN